MRPTAKWLFRLMLFNAVIWAVGQAITRSKTSSDLTADDLEFYTFWNGDEHVARSDSLRRVKARTVMGGATIDLRKAIPSEQGLSVDVDTRMAGTAVLVPRGWNVDVVEETRSSEVVIKIDHVEGELADGPEVTINLRTTFGGALVGHELPADYTT